LSQDRNDLGCVDAKLVSKMVLAVLCSANGVTNNNFT
jgi:hypothetical protein